MALNTIEKTALERFRDLVAEALQGEAPEVTLFGSKARGDDRKDSDLDVLVLVSSEDWRLCDRVYDVATTLLLETGVCISPKVLNRKSFAQMRRDGSSFAGNILRDAVAI